VSLLLVFNKPPLPTK